MMGSTADSRIIEKGVESMNFRQGQEASINFSSFISLIFASARFTAVPKEDFWREEAKLCHIFFCTSAPRSNKPHQQTMITSILTQQAAATVARIASKSARPAQVHLRHVHIERRIEELKIELPTAPLPKANYNIVCISGDTLYVSGHLPIKVRLNY
jgi:hypothetical protein